MAQINILRYDNADHVIQSIEPGALAIILVLLTNAYVT